MHQLILSLLVLLAVPAPAASSNDRDMRRATVQIFFTASAPDYAQPWQPGRQGGGTGSGVVIDGRRILTNGHVVANAAYISVRKSGDIKKYPARVAFVGHDGETAVITVDDESFFSGTIPAKFGGLPFQRDKVAVYGYPIGGTDLSVTEGIVSRVGVTVYTHSSRALLAIQTDAAINPGNSGGALINMRGELVGINTAILSKTGGYQGIGLAIPTSMARPISEMLARDGKVSRGYLGVGTRTATAALAQQYKLGTSHGAVIDGVEPSGPAGKIGLIAGDVVVAIDGTEVKTGDALRNTIAMIRPGTTVALDVVRVDQSKKQFAVRLGERPATMTRR